MRRAGRPRRPRLEDRLWRVLACARGARSASAARRGRAGSTVADGAELTPVLRTGTFATHTVVPVAAAVSVPRELPVEQACLIGCAVATGVMSVLETAKVWEGARVGVIGCGAVGLSVDPGRADRRRRRDPRDRPRRAQARAGAAFGATDAEPGPVDFVFDVVGRRATFEQALGLLARGGTLVLIGLSPAGERRDARPAAAVREARADPRLARRRPPAAGGLPAARAVGARRQARPRRRWSRARRRSTGWERGARRDARAAT